MQHLYLGGVAVLLREHLYDQGPQRRILPELPGRIAAADRHLAAQQVTQQLQLLQEHLLLRVHIAAHTEGGHHGIRLRGENAQIQGGLDQALYLPAPLQHTVGSALQQGQDAVGGVSVHGQNITPAGCYGDSNITVGHGILPAEDLFHLLADNRCLFRIRHGQNSAGRDGNGVILAAAGESDQPAVVLLQKCVQDPAQQHHGVSPAPVDGSAGVAAQKAGDSDLHRFSREGIPLYRHCNINPGSTGATGGDLTLRLGVQVQKQAALKARQVDAGSTLHPDLLVHRKHDLQGRMGNILAIQQGQAHSHGDAVVCAQGGAFGVDQVPVHHQIQALTSHVLGAIRGHFTDHVHVTLEHHGGGVLIARGTGLAEDHIPQLILLHRKATIAAKLHQIIAEGLCVSAAVGNTAQLLKPMKYPMRLQAFQYCHNFSSFLFYFLQV